MADEGVTLDSKVEPQPTEPGEVLEAGEVTEEPSGSVVDTKVDSEKKEGSVESGEASMEPEESSSQALGKRPMSDGEDDKPAKRLHVESEHGITIAENQVSDTDGVRDDDEDDGMQSDDMRLDDGGSLSPEPYMSPPRAPVHMTQYVDTMGSTEDMSLPGHFEVDETAGNTGGLFFSDSTAEFTYSTSPDLNQSRSPALSETNFGRQVTDSERRKYVGCSNTADYEMEKKVGEGTFGEVRIGRHKDTKKVFALKKVLMHNEKEGIPITALREIKILKSLNHPNIVSLSEMAVKKGDKKAKRRGEINMVFPYMDHDLTGLLENPNVCFSPPQIKSYMKQLLEGTKYLHYNAILHRDMKTANILVDNRGNLRIADFGLARAYSKTDSNVNYTNCVVTRWYRPPELLLGATKYGPPIDMWGVGCVFGEILRRRPILMGGDDLDQLDKIFQLCGTPTSATWPGMSALPGCRTIDGFTTSHQRSIRSKFHHFSNNWESSHELGSRERRNQANELSAVPGAKSQVPVVPPHYDVTNRRKSYQSGGDRRGGGGQYGAPGSHGPHGYSGGGGTGAGPARDHGVGGRNDHHRDRRPPMNDTRRNDGSRGGISGSGNNWGRDRDRDGRDHNSWDGRHREPQDSRSAPVDRRDSRDTRDRRDPPHAPPPTTAPQAPPPRLNHPLPPRPPVH
ncbi:serine/threonine protein kinase, CMGC, CDC2/CDK sub [Blyttiomyces sp. JEL0837]|nr:serine/threonine protein kinase, CMGC, CDC2/CDK sub [Blyttiomyces sp. JEL0837]